MEAGAGEVGPAQVGVRQVCLGEIGLAQPEPSQIEARELVTTDEQAQHWMTVLNDARLAVGTALDVTPEWDFTALTPSDPNYELHAVYAWMTELLSALLGVVAG